MDFQAVTAVLEGKIRGQPVAIRRFDDTPPAGFDGLKVDPCQILRHAMDDGRRVFFDREHQDCVHGAFITGVHPGNEQIRSGRLLTDYIPAYNLDAAYTFNSGEYILPQGTVSGFCATPLSDMPAGFEPEWVVLVCTPATAALAGAARAVKDGTRPDTAAGNSFCSDLFVTPIYTSNVVVTTGDMGGRINNRLKESEMFVIIPVQWLEGLLDIFGKDPDVKGIYEATRPEDSAYWQRQRDKAARASGDLPGKPQAERLGLTITLPWESDALDAIAKAPRFVRAMAVGNVEDYAGEHGHDRITLSVVEAQAESVGMGRFMRQATGKTAFWRRWLGSKRDADE